MKKLILFFLLIQTTFLIGQDLPKVVSVKDSTKVELTKDTSSCIFLVSMNNTQAPDSEPGWLIVTKENKKKIVKVDYYNSSGLLYPKEAIIWMIHKQ